MTTVGRFKDLAPLFSMLLGLAIASGVEVVGEESGPPAANTAVDPGGVASRIAPFARISRSVDLDPTRDEGDAKREALRAAEDLILAVERDPGGHYDQMCSSPPISRGSGEAVTFTPYDIDVGYNQHFSSESFDKLRRMRAEVVAVLSGELRDLTARPSHGGAKREDFHDPQHTPYERGAPIRAWPWEDHGMRKMIMLIDLNGVEALPALLEFGTGLDPGSRELGDVLATVTAILRAERYEPLLRSDMEENYKKKVLEVPLRSRRTNAVLTKTALTDEDKRWVVIDPIYDVPAWAPSGAPVELTADRRRQILTWGREFLRDTPLHKWLAAKGMTAVPVAR